MAASDDTRPITRPTATAAVSVNAITQPSTVTACSRGRSAGASATSAVTVHRATNSAITPPEQTEHDVLHHDLLHQPASARAERRPYGHIASSRETMREEKIGDVDARHHEHEADCREQQEQRGLDAADGLIEERDGGSAPAGVGGRPGLFELARHGREIRCRGVDR